LPVAATLALTAAASISSLSSFNAGDWLICGLDRDDSDGVEDAVGLVVTCGFGALNAPVDAFCRRSNSSCSLGGRRGGAGPVAKAVRRVEWVKNRRDGRRNFGGRNRDIVIEECITFECLF
jgi:hypothetical protein